jgi:hypothetical protein
MRAFSSQSIAQRYGLGIAFMSASKPKPSMRDTREVGRV